MPLDNRSGSTNLRLSLAVFIAVVTASYGLHVLIAATAWWFELALASALVVGAAALTRALTRRWYLPTVAAVIVLVAFVTVRFAADTAILGVIPGIGTGGRFRDLGAEAFASIQSQSVPASADTGILFLLLVGVGIIAVVADLVAITRRSPALAGIPLLVLALVPAMTNLDLSDGFAFALAAAGYLWLLLAAREHGRLRLAVLAGAVTIVAAIVVPSVLPTSVSIGGGDSGLVSTGVNPTIDLGKDLASSVNSSALVYSTSSGHPEYLRMVTLDRFSGADWAPRAPKQSRSHGMNAFAAPAGLSGQVARTKETTKITIGDLRSPWLPLPYPTSSVTGLWGDWYWESDTLAASSPTVGIENQIYQVASLTVQPTPEQLTAAGSTVPAGFDKYLALPSKLPKIISDTAQKVAGGEQGSYAKAIALQQYFLSGSFTYSVQAPVKEGYDGTSMDVVAKFLQVRSGYCVHFASAMAVMARSLGIPARIGVGFQPGSVMKSDGSNRTRYNVTAHDLHAWPELYFADIGWVRFEPTPGRGAVPDYADLNVAGVPAPLSPAQLAAQSATSPAPATAPTGRGNQLSDISVGTSRTAQSLSTWIWVGIAFIALLLLLLLPALRRRFVRAARLRAATAGEAWTEILATAEDLGLRMSPALTPRQTALELAPAAAGEQLDRLRRALERESFASSGSPGIDPEDVRFVTARLYADATKSRRLVARVAPVSVWQRVLGLFRRRA
ncbi:MAG: DUF3488 and transglutaminase-like domain-containing protein [Lacisediminihabitans sp.]